MPTKRRILSELKRDELVAAADAFELEVSDRRVREELLKALSSSRKATAAALLGDLPRTRLKEICRALGIDDSGRAKADLVKRLTGKSSNGAQAARRSPAKKNSNGKGGNDQELTPDAEAAAREAQEAAERGRLTVEQLERYLWSAADILRGQIDSSDYKNYIFGLLFLKRLSDRFEEESELLREEGADPEDPDEHQFYVPRAARWSEIQKVATNLGETLNTACDKLEDENSSLEGVLGGIDFNDERRLGDSKSRDAILHRLVQHFSQVDLRNANLSEPDMLGRAYEYLIERFADDAGKKGGEFYTPHQVVRLLVEILDPKEGMHICDPTCGSGGMLIQSAKHIVENGGQPRNFALYGQEKNLGTWAICKMNMLLHGLPDEQIEKGDTIRDPKLVRENGELMLFERVIANPPFSLDGWGHEVAESDPYGRFRFGIPPKTKGDLAFVQHMVATLTIDGKMGVVMPHGILFRGSSEGKIRQGLVEEDLIEAVVGLPPNLFYGTGIPAALLVLHRQKPADRKGKVFFVEASREFREGSNQNYLRDEHVKKIAKAVHAYKDVERYARVVDTEEIKKNDFNLNITRYVDTAEAEETIDLANAIAKLQDAEAERDKTKAKMDGFLKELGLDR